MATAIQTHAKARALISASVLALGATGQVAMAQDCTATQPCTIVVTQNDQSITANGPTRIINKATGTSITQTNSSYLLIENMTGASITGLTLSPQVMPPAVRSNTTIVNAGTIDAAVVFANGGVYVNAGGTVTDTVTAANANVPINSPLFASSFKTEVFINRTASDTGVDGPINPGNGFDNYVQSFATSANHAIPTSLPAYFEQAGVEALGDDTTVTLRNAVEGEGSAGLFLLGNGHIVNNAIINEQSLAGTGLPPANAATIRVRAIGYGGVVGETGAVTIPLPSGSTQVGIGGALASFTNAGTVNGDITLRAARFTNDGTINLDSAGAGTLILSAADQDFAFFNSGTVSMTNNGVRAGALTDSAVALATALDASVAKAVTIGNSGRVDGGLSFAGVASSFAFDNSDTISTAGNPNDIDRAVELEVGYYFENALNPALQNKVVAESVTANNSGTLDGGIDLEAVTRTFAFTNSGTILQDAQDDEGAAVGIGIYDYDDDQGNEDVVNAESVTFANSGDILGSVEMELEASAVSVTNSGTIAQDLVIASNVFAYGAAALELDQETTLSSRLTITNSGTISAVDHAGSAVAISVEAGDVSSGIAGAETATADIVFTNSGTITSSGGSYLTPGNFIGQPGQLFVDLATALAIDADSEGASTISITNEADGLISARGQTYIGLPTGSMLAPDQPSDAGGVALAARATTVNIVNNGTILGSAGGPLRTADGQALTILDGDDVDFAGVIGGAIDTFAAADTITNGASGVIGGGIATRDGDDQLTNNGAITGNVDLGAGNDAVRNYGTLTGNLTLGAGDDLFVQGINAVLTGIADGGEGNDIFQIDVTGGGVLNNAIYDQLVGFETLGLTGSGSFTSDAPLQVETIALAPGAPIEFGEDAVIETQGQTAVTGSAQGDELANRGTINGNVDLGAGDDNLTNSGSVNGNVALGDGNDRFTNSGTIAGDLDLGSGNNLLVLQPGSTLTGAVIGTSGTDVVQAGLSGTATQPQELDLSQYRQVEQFVVTQGTGAINGTATFDQVSVDAGRLIGRVGSTINADVAVSSGATFGSAGTVNGDIVVNGTLSPGASPGTMRVNGDIVLASGSTTLFEMTPTLSDAVVIDGRLTIGTGTTLRIVGERPLTPGVAYDLITTTGGISGAFTTTDKAATVLGFVRQSANSLQLLGTFQLRAGASAQVQAVNAYLNGLLTAGTATPGIFTAIPTLVGSGGFANQAALSRLTPEAYASAGQMGIENGLAISGALRTAHYGISGEEPRLYALGQGFGTWRNFRADAARGTARADVRSSGFLGGIGFGSDMFALSAIVGKVYASQPISGLAARNKADGLFFGGAARVSLGGFTIGGSAIWDRSDAETRRTLLDGTRLESDYRLRGTTFDGYARYDIALGGSGWQLGPQVGVTHVRVKQGAARETGGSPFALLVDGRTTKATFLTADLALTMMPEAIVRPWLSAGLRHKLSGDAPFARAGFTGVSARFTVPGAARDKDFVNVGAGADWRVGQAVTLFARGDSEFGADNNARSLTAGMRLRF